MTDQNSSCETSWRSILAFYLFNYIFHCVTVIRYPGESVFQTAIAVLNALLYPTSGVIRVLDAIYRRARFMKVDEVEKAAKAGALCMVVRSKDWQPQPGDRIFGVKVVAGDGTSENKMTFGLPSWHRKPLSMRSPAISIASRDGKVHGVRFMPKGYELDWVPSDIELEKPSIDGDVSIEVGSTYEIVAKTVIAICQLIHGCFTLVRARSDKTQSNGYVSFGPTIMPYLVMSGVNLLGQLATPSYPTLYLVSSPEMTEAKRRGGIFEGVVGNLILPDWSNDTEEWKVAAGTIGELTEDNNDEKSGLPQVHDASLSQDMEPGKVSSGNTSLVL